MLYVLHMVQSIRLVLELILYTKSLKQHSRQYVVPFRQCTLALLADWKMREQRPLYPASGGAEDWAKGRMGIKYAYLFELRPEETVWDGFLLDENQIIPTARETFEAVKVIAARTNTMFPPKMVAQKTTNSFTTV
ncbi:unnamed protein product [Onchocerca ochengi]|uniref:Peptidase_M14 domain-containing protein n=1 Tax=Onchocerca ochengi TaxID=42157 RepID=A0A182EIS4_ONCOC|nr:unnamed protein product [Onchocerca ochengi]